MTTMLVDTKLIDDSRIASYLASTDRRVTIGFRFALERLGIPLPEYAERKPAGRPSPARLMALVDADAGTRRTYRDEKKFAPRRL